MKVLFRSHCTSFPILILLISILFSPALASEDTKDDALLSALALNYCRDSLVKILTYNDRVVLDEEYNTIINNIDLSKIQDEEIIDLLEELMDTLSFFKLQEGDRARLIKKHEEKVANAFYSSFCDVGNIIYVGKGNPYTMVSVALTQIGGAYANYRKNISEYRDELDEKMWKLEKNAIEQINDIQKNFLRSSWNVMKKREIPDKWRLTDIQLVEYVNTLKDEDIERRLRKLRRMSEYFNAYPPYWYYFAIAALDAAKKTDATEALLRFDKIHQGFFREDHIYTSALMNRILLLDVDSEKETIVNLLSKMVAQSTKDERKNIFAALKYVECGHFSEAVELLQLNIDNKKNISLNMMILGEIYILEQNEKKLHILVDRMVKEDRVRNQDVLYLVGKMPEIKKLNIMKAQIVGINVSVDKTIYGMDNIEVFVPIKWIIDDFEHFKVKLKTGERDFNAKSFKGDGKRRGAVYFFEDVADFDEVLKMMRSLETVVVLSHLSGTVQICGVIEEVCEEREKGIIDKGMDKAKGWTNKLLGSEGKTRKGDKKSVCKLVFTKQRLLTNAGSYLIAEDGTIKKQ